MILYLGTFDFILIFILIFIFIFMLLIYLDTCTRQYV